MISRRTFLQVAAGSLTASKIAWGRERAGRLALYANVGADMLHYEVDVDRAVITRRESLRLPAGVQYAWPHASGHGLYVVSSDWAKEHFLSVLRIDGATGRLSLLGEAVRLPFRPIHVTTDKHSRYVLVAFNAPSAVRVYRTAASMEIAGEVPEPAATDGGIFAHQIRVTPDDQHAILVTRGNPATAQKPEDPGALKMFDFRGGQLTRETSIAPDGGKHFGPRHLDFHPTKPWVYVSLETQSQLFTYRLVEGRLASQPDFRTDTVEAPGNKRPRQLAGTVHVHPNGRFVYVANRADGTVDYNGSKVFGGGENTVAVYEINPRTGEPIPIQYADTRKVYPRTFAIDPSGRLLVAQHTLPVNIRQGDDVKVLPAGMTCFRVGVDGRLTYQSTEDVETGTETMFWMGLMQI